MDAAHERLKEFKARQAKRKKRRTKNIEREAAKPKFMLMPRTSNEPISPVQHIRSRSINDKDVANAQGVESDKLLDQKRATLLDQKFGRLYDKKRAVLMEKKRAVLMEKKRAVLMEKKRADFLDKKRADFLDKKRDAPLDI